MDALRQGRSPELAPLPIQYVDYSVWQRRWLEEGGMLKRQLGYWQEKLAGVPESLDLATDYPRPSVQSFAGATQEFALDAQLTGQLKGWPKSRAARCTWCCWRRSRRCSIATRGRTTSAWAARSPTGSTARPKG